MQFERRMSSAEALMWRLDRDPVLSGNYASVSFLDRPIDFASFQQRIERASRLVPRLRQRVQEGAGMVLPPTWVDDPTFDITHHLKHVVAPGDGDGRAVLQLASEITALPLDRHRPLWEFSVIGGLPDGRGALIQKLHHTLIDGEGILKLSLQFLDLERDAPPPPALTEEQIAAAAGPSSPPAATPLDQMRELLEESMRRSVRMMERTSELFVDPRRLPELSAAARSAARGVISQLTDIERARSPLWKARSVKRRLEVLRTTLEATQLAAKSLGGTLNTAFLTAAAAAAGAYHRDVGLPVEELRASMAISTRTRESGANAFTLARFIVPTGDMAIGDRFKAIQDITERARATAREASLDKVASVASVLPTPLIHLLARQHAHTVDFATSNIRAAPFPVYIGGAQLLETYPLGPLVGAAFNLTLLSYNGGLNMGINVDTAAVEEPERLRECLRESFASLATVTRKRPSRRTPTGSAKPAAKAGGTAS